MEEDKVSVATIEMKIPENILDEWICRQIVSVFGFYSDFLGEKNYIVGDVEKVSNSFDREMQKYINDLKFIHNNLNEFLANLLSFHIELSSINNIVSSRIQMLEESDVTNVGVDP